MERFIATLNIPSLSIRELMGSYSYSRRRGMLPPTNLESRSQDGKKRLETHSSDMDGWQGSAEGPGDTFGTAFPRTIPLRRL